MRTRTKHCPNASGLVFSPYLPSLPLLTLLSMASLVEGAQEVVCTCEVVAVYSELLQRGLRHTSNTLSHMHYSYICTLLHL